MEVTSARYSQELCWIKSLRILFFEILCHCLSFYYLPIGLEKVYPIEIRP